MHAYLLTGIIIDKPLETIQSILPGISWNSSEITHLSATEGKIGIDDIRAFIKSLTLAPKKGSQTLAILSAIEEITDEAQQALLKTLEEPPSDTIIILHVTNESILFETVLSRMERVALTGSPESHIPEPSLATLREASIGKRLACVEQIIKSKADTKNWITNALYYYSAQYADAKNKSPHELLRASYEIRLLMHASSAIKQNMNHKMILDQLVMSLR